MSLTEGRLLGRYEILERIGEGGMGKVFRARDTVLGRLVAVKVLAGHLSPDEDLKRRFEREARAVAALSHPAILAIHDFGTEEGVPYAVTELLEGRTLRQLVHTGRLPWQEALGLSIQMAEGLAAAHSAGIIHRDLKPENVFLTRDGRIKILDFGLAKQNQQLTIPRDPGPQSDAGLTADGVILGTPGYMAPEQLRGERVDARADIFAAGCVLYELLTGHKAFGRTNSADRLVAVLVQEPTAPSVLVAGLPIELERTILRCLEKSPRDRFGSGAELLQALRAVQGEGATERRLSTRATKPPRSRASRSASSIAVLPFLNLSGEPSLDYIAEGLADSLINGLSRFPRLRVMARSTVFRFRGEDDALRVGRELGVTSVVTGRMEGGPHGVAISVELVDSLEGWRLWGDRFQRETTDLQAIETDIARGIATALKLNPQRRNPSKKHRIAEEAHLFYLKGRFQWAKSTIESLRKAIEHYEAAIEVDPLYAEAYAAIAECYADLGSDRWGAVSAREALPRARAAAGRALELDPSLVDAHTALGLADLLEWKWGDASRRLKKALELSVSDSSAHYYLGLLRTIQGRFDEAIDHRLQSIDVDPLSLLKNTDLAWTYFCSRRYAEAISQCRRTLDIEPGFLQAYFWLGFSQVASGDAEGGLQTYQKAVEISHGAPTMRGALAYALASAGKRAEAELEWQSLRAESEKRHIPLVALVLPAIALGETESALSLLETAATARASFLIGVEVYQFFDPIRGEKRFDGIRERVGLRGISIPASAVPGGTRALT